MTGLTSWPAAVTTIVLCVVAGLLGNAWWQLMERLAPKDEDEE